MSRFFIVTEEMAKADRDALTRWLHSRPWGFAHWLEPISFLAGLPDDYTAEKLYDQISAVLPSGEPSSTIVVRIHPTMTYWRRAKERTMGLDEGFMATGRIIIPAQQHFSKTVPTTTHGQALRNRYRRYPVGLS